MTEIILAFLYPYTFAFLEREVNEKTVRFNIITWFYSPNIQPGHSPAEFLY